MKKILLILLCFPFCLIAQTQQNNTGSLYFLSNLEEETLVWDDYGYGYDWQSVDFDEHVEFSEYDVATSILTTETLDTALVEQLEEPISCFDPTTNMLYAVNPYTEDDTVYIGALDVTTGDLTLVPLGVNDPWFNWDPGSPGDTVVDIYIKNKN